MCSDVLGAVTHQVTLYNSGSCCCSAVPMATGDCAGSSLGSMLAAYACFCVKDVCLRCQRCVAGGCLLPAPEWLVGATCVVVAVVWPGQHSRCGAWHWMVWVALPLLDQEVDKKGSGKEEAVLSRQQAQDK